MKKKIISLILIIAVCILNFNITTVHAASEYNGLEVMGTNPYNGDVKIIAPGNNVGEQIYNILKQSPFSSTATYNVIANKDEDGNPLKYSYFCKGGTTYKVGTSSKEWNDYNFTSGTYQIYALTRYSDQNKFFYRHIYNIRIKIAYKMKVVVSGFNGGGITYLEQNYPSGSQIEYEPTSNLTFRVQDVKSYTPTVIFNGSTIKPDASGTYTISSSTVASASDKQIYVNYSIEKGKESTVKLLSEHATITFNGSTNTTQMAAQGQTYSVSAVAHDGYKINGIYLDGTKVIPGTNGNINITKGQHTITVDTSKIGIFVHDGSINFREDMDKSIVAKAIYDAIYDNNTYPAWTSDKLVVDTTSVVNGHFVEYYGPSFFGGANSWNRYCVVRSDMIGTFDLGKSFGQGETARVRFVHAEYKDNQTVEETSNEATLILNKIKVSLKDSDKDYTGKPCDIDLSINDNSDLTWSGNVGKLTDLQLIGYYDKDYKELDAAPIDIGTYYIKVKAVDGLGCNISDYLKFSIKQRNISKLASINVAGISISGVNIPGDFSFDGTAKLPDIVIKDGDKVLQKDKDYTLSYQNSNGEDDNVTNAGTVTVTIDFIGNYSGSITKTYTINKADATVTVLDATKIYDKKPVNVIYTTTHKDDISEDVIIEYKEKSESDDKYTTTAPTNVGDYVVKVTINETSNYKKTSPVIREFSIKPKEIVLNDYSLEKVYDGTTIGQLSDVTLGTLENIEEGDQVELDLSEATFTLDNSTVGATVVTVTNAKLIGEDAKNYSLPRNVEWEAEVKQREITDNVYVNDKHYHGANEAQKQEEKQLNDKQDNINAGKTDNKDVNNKTAKDKKLNNKNDRSKNIDNKYILTGDDSLVGMYILIMICSGLLLVALHLKKQKNFTHVSNDDSVD